MYSSYVKNSTLFLNIYKLCIFIEGKFEPHISLHNELLSYFFPRNYLKWCILPMLKILGNFKSFTNYAFLYRLIREIWPENYEELISLYNTVLSNFFPWNYLKWCIVRISNILGNFKTFANYAFLLRLVREIWPNNYEAHISLHNALLYQFVPWNYLKWCILPMLKILGNFKILHIMHFYIGK